MHFEILVEDQSGKKALEILVPKILGPENTFKIYWYKGIGHIPRNMKDTKNASKRILLDNLPKLLKGVHPEMANLPDIFVARKILSSKYQPYVCGKIFRAPRSQPNLPISG
ncbi:hypothetical protein [uncultured Desulfosarcina sp.]|uniref:hypothetical protein n=1 Tax=uncultured Desulfosarcina sp. TaxID=218289 RepID=UPI0029C71D97|nr:hypothetical protein [uncultured Desulfosarcina sp.]